jgi:hypothetical protein
MAEFFEQNKRKSFKKLESLAPIFLPAIHYNSPQTKCIGYMLTLVTGSAGL